MGMLRRACERLTAFGDRCTLIQESADVLPFPDQMFDAVACLETLEFTPRPEDTLGELMRVLRPGGVLLLTNRIGRARWFPGRTYDDETLIDLLCGYPLSKIEIHSWNTFYDQVWVRKAGQPSPEGRGAERLDDWLCNAEHYALQEGILRKR
jgi:ubiquinone/menaquinone biosynthesis C-methylase UbiE